MFFVSADANTSASAPCWICCTSCCEPAKLNVGSRFDPDESASLVLLNADVSDAAAKTSSGVFVCVATVVLDDEELFELLPHAVPTNASETSASNAAILRTINDPSVVAVRL